MGADDTTIADVLRKIEHDLAWRGPGGQLLGNVVLTRSQAQYLRDAVLEITHERDALVEEGFGQ